MSSKRLGHTAEALFMDLNFEIHCIPIFRPRMVEARELESDLRLFPVLVLFKMVSWVFVSWRVLGSVPGWASVCQAFLRQSVGHSRTYMGLDSLPIPFLGKTSLA